MSSTISMSLKKMLSIPGVSFSAEMNGDPEDALAMLKERDPDLEYVEAVMRPVLVIKLPDYANTRLVDVAGDRLLLTCSGEFRKYFMQWCEFKEIDYKLLGE